MMFDFQVKKKYMYILKLTIIKQNKMVLTKINTLLFMQSIKSRFINMQLIKFTSLHYV